MLPIFISCSLPYNDGQPFIFPTRDNIFPTLTASPTSPSPSITLAPPPPTPTARTWPPPYFGSPGPTPVTQVPTPYTLISNPESINFLLIGSDTRTGSSFRTDTLIVVSFQPATNLVTLISIPRDLYVYIPGWTMQRINAAYLHGELGYYPGGGPELLKDTILYNFGIQIDHFAMVNFEGFKQIIDTLGGIDLPISCAFTEWHIINPNGDPQDEDNWELITIGPGVVHMDGDLALWYARSRIRSSDFDRGRRQQEVLRAIYSQALQIGMIARMPELYSQLNSTITTDIGLDDVINFAPYAGNLSAAKIRSYFINLDRVSGWRTPLQNASVLLPNGRAIYDMLQEALGPPNLAEEIHIESIVEIWNGTNNLDWDQLAAERLHFGGFDTQIALADQRNYSQTKLFDFTPEQDPEQSAAILNTLGLQSSNLVGDPNPSSTVDYRLVIGADYRPCFDPADISR